MDSLILADSPLPRRSTFHSADPGRDWSHCAACGETSGPLTPHDARRGNSPWLVVWCADAHGCSTRIMANHAAAKARWGSSGVDVTQSARLWDYAQRYEVATVYHDRDRQRHPALDRASGAFSYALKLTADLHRLQRQHWVHEVAQIEHLGRLASVRTAIDEALALCGHFLTQAEAAPPKRTEDVRTPTGAR